MPDTHAQLSSPPGSGEFRTVLYGPQAAPRDPWASNSPLAHRPARAPPGRRAPATARDQPNTGFVAQVMPARVRQTPARIRLAVASLDSFKSRQTLDRRRQDLHLLLDPGGREERPRRCGRAAVLDEGPPGEPAALRGRPLGHRRPTSRPRSAWLGDRGKTEHEIAFRPARVLMQDFTGVPGGGRSRGHARRHGGARRRPAEDQPAGAGRPRHRPLGACRRVRHPEGASPTTSTSNTSATASATRSCAGASRPSTISRWCRRAPASAIRSISNTCRRPSGPVRGRRREVAYPDTLVGTDSHTTMVNGLAVLGWGVGGIEAEAAMLGQPVSMLIPEVVGFKLIGQAARGHHRHRPRAHRHADAAQEGRGRQVRRVLRPRPRRPAARRPRHHRQHGARVRRHLRLLPDRPEDPRLS